MFFHLLLREFVRPKRAISIRSARALARAMAAPVSAIVAPRGKTGANKGGTGEPD